MHTLVLGGTGFLGRAVVDQSLADGHEITMLNRGQTNPGLFPDIEHLIGDRDGDLALLAGRSFDAVIDTCGYFPRQVRSVVDALRGNIGHYTFVSSVDVYNDHSVPGADESADLAGVVDLDDETPDDSYGGFKALCEAALDEVLPGRVHHVRSGMIVGPYDGTGRFTYWVQRFAKEGAVLAPEPRHQPVQMIDVRDLAQWILHAANNDIAGAMNAVSTPGSLTIESILTEINSLAAEPVDFTWVGEEFLFERGVRPWHHLPLWAPPGSFPSHAGYLLRSNARAVENGLVLRPLADTINAIQEELATSDLAPAGVGEGAPGLRPDEEASLLREWGDR